jgi:hypothetical protein
VALSLAPVTRRIKRWNLQLEIKARQAHITHIQRQRAHDMEVERILTREIAQARSELNSLN